MTKSPIRRDVKLGTPAALPHENRLAIADGITVNEWLEIGREIEKLGDSSAWWIGDWLAYGDRYRREHHDAVADIDERWSTYRVYRWVSQRVAPERRVRGLSWGHHRTVAGLDDDEQSAWLTDAKLHGWKRPELERRLAIAAQKPLPPPALALKATGPLYDLCARAAAHAGVPAAEWAHQALERAARAELGETPHLGTTHE